MPGSFADGQNTNPSPPQKPALATTQSEGMTQQEFIAALKARKVCALSIASNAAGWWYAVKEKGGHFEAYLDLVDCRDGGGKMLHQEALASLRSGPVIPTRGGWAD